MKQHTIRLILLVVCTLFAVCAYATEKDKGPESMMLHSTLDPAKKPKPAFFPHAEHQERQHCSECHHGKGADGKQVPYMEGQTIAKCESCHNSKAEGMSTDYNTFQKVGHARCRECHRQTDVTLVKCSVCHTDD
jgi:hypothetical protein